MRSEVAAEARVNVSDTATQEMPVPMPEDLLPELKVLLKTAMERSPNMILSGLDLARAEADVLLTRAAQLPNLSASLGYYRSETKNETIRSSGNEVNVSKSQGPTYNIALSQPLYHWGALQAQTDISALQVKIREKQYQSAYLDLARSIRSQYLGLIYKKRAIAISVSDEERAKRNIDTQQRMVDAGQVFAGMVEAARIAYKEATLAREQGEADYEGALKILKRMAGISQVAELAVANDLQKITYAADNTKSYLNSKYNWDFSEHPQVLSARHEIDQSDLRYEIAKVRLRPKINATFTTGLSPVNSGGADEIKGRSDYLGITANWTLFDGFATKGAKLSALAEKRSAERRLANQHEILAERLAALQKEIDFAGRRLDMVQYRTDQAAGGITRAEVLQQRGTSAEADIELAKRNFQSAYLGLIASRTDFLNKWCEYVSLLGIDPALHNLPNRFIRHGR